MESSKNHRRYRRLLLDSSPVSVLLQAGADLAKAGGSDLVTGVVSRLHAYTKQFLCDAICPRCGRQLYLSDLPQYAYVCYDCDENFFDVEVVHKEVRNGDQ